MFKGDVFMKVKTRNLIGFMAVIVVLIVILISIIKIYGIDISVSLETWHGRCIVLQIIHGNEGYEISYCIVWSS